MALRREQESAEAIVTGATSRQQRKPDGLTTREGLNLAGRHDHRWSCSGSDEAESAELRAAILVAEKECCVIPQGLPGTAVRGPACTVVWEAGGETLPTTRFCVFDAYSSSRRIDVIASLWSRVASRINFSRPGRMLDL